METGIVYNNMQELYRHDIQLINRKSDNNSQADKSKINIYKNDTSVFKELTAQEQKKADELKKIDKAVRSHESAHLAAGAGIVRGGASFTYTMGPDGKMYATGGEVSIDISEVPDNPEATIRKMQQVKRAALAPVDPSPQDRSIAARASSIESKARAEAQSEKSDENYNSKNSPVETYSKNQNSYNKQIGSIVNSLVY